MHGLSVDWMRDAGIKAKICVLRCLRQQNPLETAFMLIGVCSLLYISKVCMKKFRWSNFLTEVHLRLQAAQKEIKKSVLVNIGY